MLCARACAHVFVCVCVMNKPLGISKDVSSMYLLHEHVHKDDLT